MVPGNHGRGRHGQALHGLDRFSWAPTLQEGCFGREQWTGNEHKDMERVFIPVLAGVVDPEVLTAVRGALNFISYAQYQSHTSETLSRMQKALTDFHSAKGIFVDLGIRHDFNIPKLHSMLHYIASIKRLGSCDGYNSESP
jgi:hypothetical protein